MASELKYPDAPTVFESARRWLRRCFAEDDGRDDVRRINKLILPLLVCAVGASFFYGMTQNAAGPVLLWVFASLTAGGTAGFLFGIPKAGIAIRKEANGAQGDGGVRESDRGDGSADHGGGTHLARPNTNLEEVSDWLTKILVGLTLVNFQNLQEYLATISRIAAASIDKAPNASHISIATAIIVGFALIGFVAMYLYMRLFVQGAIVRSDDQMHRFRSAVAHALQESEEDHDAGVEDVAPALPSAASIRAAQEVAAAAPRHQPELMTEPLRQLASQYDTLRQNTAYSFNRTRKMTEIVHQMRPYAIGAARHIEGFVGSDSAGERLAAIVILQMKYMREFMPWLARRLVEERPFVAHQAANALLGRALAEDVSDAEYREMTAAVSAAKEERIRKDKVDSSVDRLIDQVLSARDIK